MKKVFTLIAVAAMFAACAGNSNKAAEATADSTAVEAVEATPDTTACDTCAAAPAAAQTVVAE